MTGHSLAHASGGTLIGSVVAAVVASSTLRWRDVEKSVRRPVFQPRDQAFGIWSVLFASSFAHGVLLVLSSADEADESASTIGLLLSASYLCCASWCVAISRGARLASTVAIAAAALLALAACYWRPLEGRSWTGSEARSLRLDVVEEASAGLLAGWLSAATAISAASSTERGYLLLGDRAWTPVVLVSLVGAASVLRGAPVPLLPLVWASLWSESPCGLVSGTASSLAVFFFVVASVRRWWVP